MARNIEKLTFEVTFYKGEVEKVQMFTINVDRADYDDQKDAAIDHVTAKWEAIKAVVGEGFLPKFKTFRILNCRRLDDLGFA